MEQEVLDQYGISLTPALANLGFAPTAIPVNGGVPLSTNNVGLVIHHAATKLYGAEEMQWRKQMLVVVGQPFNMGAAPWWENFRTSWEATNYNIMQNNSHENVKKLNELILTGIQAGWSYEEMTKQIQSLPNQINDITAQFIATDQICKVNSALAKAQYEYTGYDTYMWNTARDDKVRGNPKGMYPEAMPDHWIMDGMICSWKDPTIYMDKDDKWRKRTAVMPQVAPGIEPLCRCLPSPIFVEPIEGSPYIEDSPYRDQRIEREHAEKENRKLFWNIVNCYVDNDDIIDNEVKLKTIADKIFSIDIPDDKYWACAYTYFLRGIVVLSNNTVEAIKYFDIAFSYDLPKTTKQKMMKQLKRRLELLSMDENVILGKIAYMFPKKPEPNTPSRRPTRHE